MTKINKGVIRRLISFALLVALCLVPLTSLPVSASTHTVTTEGYPGLRRSLNDPTITTVIWANNQVGPPMRETLTIRPGCTLIFKEGYTFNTVPAGVNFINNGTLILETNSKIKPKDIVGNATWITNNGIMINNGTLETNVINNGEYSGAGTITGVISGTNVYNITFDENYTVAPTTLVNVYAKIIGTTLMPADPTRAGYTFIEWNTMADGSGTLVDGTTLLDTLGSKTPTVYAQWASQACDITAFTLPNQVGTATISSVNISVTVPYGTDLTTLVPTIAVSDGGTVSPTSGTAADFTSSVVYTVTAEDGVATQTYTVTVTIGAQATYAVTVTSGTGGGSYPQGATVNITADTPPAGQEFDKWTSNDVTFANENMAATSFTMPTNAVTVTATYKASPPAPLAKYTITLGASGDGTVTGGGTFDENSSITVTATPNTGWSFVNWTENGSVASTSANYSFAVTADRRLVANFKADDAPEPPIDPPTTPSYSGGSYSNYVGSNKADTSPVFARAFTTADATKLFNTALAAKPEGQTSLSFRARNYTSVDKTVFAELAALAQKNGITLTVHFDTVVGKAVTYRISVNPALVTTNLDLTAKIVGGKITLPKFSPAVEVAVLLPAGITIENLKITQNGKDITATAKLWLDKNGYLHFTTTGGEIVLSK